MYGVWLPLFAITSLRYDMTNKKVALLWLLIPSSPHDVLADGGSICFAQGGVFGFGWRQRRQRTTLPRRVIRGRGKHNDNDVGILVLAAAKSDIVKRRDGEDEKFLKSLGRRERKKILIRREHERRKNAWLAKYGSAAALQQTFANEGQRTLSPSQTRALYHTLLPRSLLALSELGVLDPSDLAPLAYQARISAKVTNPVLVMTLL